MPELSMIHTSATAATNYENKIRVFFQAHSGEIRQSGTIDGNDWSLFYGSLPYVTKPQTFTPLATVSWAKLGEIRVYYLDVNHKLQEVCWNQKRNTWIAGSLNDGNFQAAPYSQLAVVHWDDETRLYYQGADDKRIFELTRSGTDPWKAGVTLRKAIRASRLAAIRTSDNRVRVYYQGTNFNLHQITSKNDWDDDIIISPTTDITPPQTSISAISFGQSLRLYYTPNPGNIIQELIGTTGSNSWSNGSTLNTAIPLSYAASVCWGNIDAIRVYSLFNGSRLGEMSWARGVGWREGNGVPTDDESGA